MSEDDDLEVGEIARHEDIFDNEDSSTPNDLLQSNTSALPDLEKKNQFELYSQKTLS